MSALGQVVAPLRRYRSYLVAVAAVLVIVLPGGSASRSARADRATGIAQEVGATPGGAAAGSPPTANVATAAAGGSPAAGAPATSPATAAVLSRTAAGTATRAVAAGSTTGGSN